jgi:CubicO group peptidase (beta-lactamase class C family)
MSFNLKKICLKVASTLTFLLFFQLTNAQYDFTEVGKKLDASHKELSKDVVTLIYKDGKIVYKKEMGTDFKANTQAPIASCSKWLTAALVMTFVDQGQLSLDDYVGKYLPIFNTYGKKYITIRQCLSHTTGIQYQQGLLGIMRLNKFASLEEEVNSFASKHEIQANAGTEFRYSSVGLNIAGRICEIVGRKSFEQLMTERILRPLAMRNTSFHADNRAVNTSGGAISTASDYMNFLVMILNKGMYNGKRILSEQAITEMQTSQTKPEMIKYAPKVAEGINYGLGEWMQEEDAQGHGLTVCSPGLFGTWPMVDNCRKYACIFFVKTLLSEGKKDIYVDIKHRIDAVIPSECK